MSTWNVYAWLLISFWNCSLKRIFGSIGTTLIVTLELTFTNMFFLSKSNLLKSKYLNLHFHFSPTYYLKIFTKVFYKYVHSILFSLFKNLSRPALENRTDIITYGLLSMRYFESSVLSKAVEWISENSLKSRFVYWRWIFLCKIFTDLCESYDHRYR